MDQPHRYSSLLLLFLVFVVELLCIQADETGACPAVEYDPDYRPGEVGDWEDETGFYQSIRVSNLVVERTSEFQTIQIWDTDNYYGRILVLDDVIQLTERDASAYNEMMAHVPLFQHAQPKRALVIGGGDGYVLNEVLKHASIEHVDHVDLDGEVVRLCEEYFPWGQAWNDSRVKLHIADGAKFVADYQGPPYDVIIQDSSDPWTLDDNEEIVHLPSGVLYERSHLEHILRILAPGGILNFQAETFNIPSDLEGIKEWRNLVLDIGFASARYGSIVISSYPTGQIGFLLCEKRIQGSASMEQIKDRFENVVTEYYHPKLHTSAFDLPLWVEKSLLQ